MRAEHLLELLPQVAGEEVQRLLEHRTAFDRVERVARLEPALELLDERALAGADGAHEIEDLPALLALERGGMEVAHDLRDRLLDAEELFAEEPVGFERLVFVEPLHARIVRVVDVGRTHPHDDVVHAGVRELRNRGILTHAFQVLEKASAPTLLLVDGAVVFDQLLEDALPVFHMDSFLDEPGAPLTRAPYGARTRRERTKLCRKYSGRVVPLKARSRMRVIAVTRTREQA